MRRRALSKLEALLFSLLVIISIFAGYAWLTRQAPAPSASPTPSKPSSITIVDSAGRYVEVPYPLKRVVCLSGDAAMALVALGAKDTIVGISQYDVGEPWAPNVTNIGDCFRPNVEAVIASNPQVVITYVKWPNPEELESKLPKHIKVVRLDFYKPSSLFAEFRLLALLVNKTERAENVIAYYEQIFNNIRGCVEKIKPEKRVRVYFESYTDYSAAGPGSGWDELLRLAGGLNVYADAPTAYPKVNPEDVIARNPDIIVKSISSTAFKAYGAISDEPLREIRDKIVKRPGWSEINAVKSGKVYLLCSHMHHELFGLISEVAYLAKWFYPDLFKDLDPSAIHKHFLEEDLGIPYEGIWVYPPPG